MNKILILGSSFTSVEIVKNAKEMQWYTIVTDNLPLQYSAAKQVADEHWMISTDDIVQLENKCRENSIKAIFSGISEFNLDRVQILCRNLGLPCYIEERAWTVARNKRLFKEKCIENGIPVAQEYTIPDDERDNDWCQIQFPVVVKPVDGCANAGLSICLNKQELIEGYRKASTYNNEGEPTLERYITGEETWNYYLIAENAVQYAYSGRVFTQPGYPSYLYSFGTNAVDGIDDYLNQMDLKCIRLLQDIGCRDGIAWIQCIRDENGNYYAIEMGHRMSADACGEVLEKNLGYNIVNWMLDTAFGVKHSSDMLPRPIMRPYSGVACVYYLFADHAGRIMQMDGFDNLNTDLFTVEFANRVGGEVAQYRVIAKIAFFARNTEEMCSIMAYINKNIVINDIEGKDLAVRYTDYEAIKKAHHGLLRE